MACYGRIFAVLVFLVYIQFRTLKRFDWSTLTHTFDSIRWSRLVLATLLTYAAYVSRAFRWSVFLRPTKPATPPRWCRPSLLDLLRSQS